MSRVKFGDVVRDCKEKIDRNDNPYEYYIAGDHMDSEDLKIRRRGCFATDDVGPAFIRLFKPGQILYGSRRTYLKKVAVADFEGVTANTTFVFETKDEDVLRQKLIPFIMLSDDFTQYSIKKSKGSTNPYILFSDIAEYEFELPNVSKQDELVDILWSLWEAKEAYRDLIYKTDELVKSQFIEMFGNPLSDDGVFEELTIADACDDIMGGGTPSKKHPEFFDGNIPWVSPKDMKSDRIEDSQDHITEEAIQRSTTKMIPENSVLMVIRSGILKHDLPIAINTVPVTINQDMKAFVVGQKIIPQYLFGYLKTIEADVLQGVRAVTADNIEFKSFQNRKIPVPPRTEQEKFASFLERSDKSKFELKQSIETINNLMSAVTRDNFK